MTYKKRRPVEVACIKQRKQKMNEQKQQNKKEDIFRIPAYSPGDNVLCDRCFRPVLISREQMNRSMLAAGGKNESA